LEPKSVPLDVLIRKKVPMKAIYRHPHLYTFLFYCNRTELDKTILDCGAGGNCPPLGIFYDHNFQTTGVEISDYAIEASKVFQNEYDMDLNIIKGDMTYLEFKDGEFSFVYSYNSIFHMKKENVKKALSEMKRVMDDKGYMFFNLLTHDDIAYGTGEKIGEGEYLQPEGNEEVVHSYYSEDECMSLIEELNFEVIYKEKRIRYMTFDEFMGPFGFIDFIVKKK